MFNFFCNGGPWHGETLRLASPTTLVFTANGQTGRYRGGRVHYPENKVFSVQFTPVNIDVRFGHDLIWEKHDV